MKYVLNRLAQVVVFFSFALTFSTSVSAAQCTSTRAEMLAVLKANYEEAPVAVGLANDGNAMEILASPKGTWTVLFVHPTGVTCMMAVGDNWEVFRLPPNL